jgi:hypothetical protein
MFRTKVAIEVFAPGVSKRRDHRVGSIKRGIRLSSKCPLGFGPDPDTDLVAGLVAQGGAGAKLSAECKRKTYVYDAVTKRPRTAPPIADSCMHQSRPDCARFRKPGTMRKYAVCVTSPPHPEARGSMPRHRPKGMCIARPQRNAREGRGAVFQHQCPNQDCRRRRLDPP